MCFHVGSYCIYGGKVVIFFGGIYVFETSENVYS